MRCLTLALALVVLATKAVHAADEPDLKPFVDALKGNTDKDKIKAMQSLAKLGKRAKDAAGDLCESACMEFNEEVKKQARAALGKVRPDLLPHVVTLLDSTDEKKVAEAAAAIGKMGPVDGAPGSRALRFGNYRGDRGRYFKEPEIVWEACITALGNVLPSDKDVVGEIGQAVTLNKHPSVRIAAARALGKLGKAYPEQRKPINS